MSTPTVRISETSHQLLKELAEQTGQTMMDVLAKALDAYRRNLSFEQRNNGDAEVQAGEEDPFVKADGQRNGPDRADKAPAALSGTVHEVGADDAVCWLEVAPGTLVKFAVPLALLHHLDPQPGLEILWSPGTDGAPPQFWKREPELPDPQRIQEVQQLNRRFREGLETWQPRVPQDQ